MDHKSVAQRVLKDVGGAGNIVAAAHCATRLRLVLKNQDKVDQAAIDNDEDLKGSFLNAGQFQIIVGPGDVNEVHKHLIAAGAPEASKDDLKSIAAKQGNIVSRFIKTIADIFVPLIPVLVGGGMLMALNSLLTSKGIFGPQAVIELFPEWADFADIVNLLSAAPFAFLPVLVGFSATKVFGGNPYLGLTMGAAMVSPALMNGYNVAASLAGAEGTDPMSTGTSSVCRFSRRATRARCCPSCWLPSSSPTLRSSSIRSSRAPSTSSSPRPSPSLLPAS